MGIRDIFKPAFERGTDLSGFQQHAGASADAALASAAQRTGGASSPGQSTLARFWDSLRGGGAQQSTTPQTSGSSPLSTAQQTTKPTLPLPPAGSVYDPHEAGNQGLLDFGKLLASHLTGEANKPTVPSRIQDPTKIKTIEIPTTGNAETDKRLDTIRTKYSEAHTQDWINKYSGADIDAAMKDLKVQIDKAPDKGFMDQTARTKLIAEYQFLETAKNFGIYSEYDLKGGDAAVKKMDDQIADLKSRIKVYKTYHDRDGAVGNEAIDEDLAAKAAGMTEEEYEQARADLAALEQYRKALHQEVKNARNVQLGTIAARIAARPDLDDLAKKGATMDGNKRAENADNTGSLYSRMTEEEQKVYDALFSSSKDAAEAYYDYLGDTLKARKGGEIAKKIDDIESDTLQTLASQGFGIASGATKAVRGLWAALPGTDNDVKNTAWDFAGAQIREDLGKMNTGLNAKNMPTGANLSQGLFDAATSTGNMVPMMVTAKAMSMILGPHGAALAPKIVAAASQTAGSAVMGLGVYGNVRDELMDQGYNEKSASTYAALNAASEVALEKVLGGFEELGGMIGIPVVEKQLNSIGNVYLRYAATMATKMMGEGTEEYLQDVIDPLFRNIALSENNEVELISEEGMYSYIVAALSVFGSPTQHLDTFRSVGRCEATGAYVNAVKNANPELYEQLLKDAMTSENDDIRELAEGLKSGEYKANNGNMGQLLLLMAEDSENKGIKASAEDFIKVSAANLAELKVEPIMNEARSKAQAEWEKIVAENPGATVLNPVETALKQLTGWDADTVREQGNILTKIFSGIIPTNSDIDALDLNNQHVRDLFKQYTGIDLDTATNKSELWLKLRQGAKAAAQTEAYQQALKEANETFLQQRNEVLKQAGEKYVANRSDELMNTEFAQKREDAVKAATTGVDIQPGQPSFFSRKKRQPIIPAAKKTETAKTSETKSTKGGATAETAVISGVEMNHNDFIKDYVARHNVSEAEAEKAWRGLTAVNSALNGGTENEQVRSTDEERVDGVASGGSVSEVSEGRAGSGQSEADTGAAAETRGGTTVDAEGLRTSGKVIAETEYTEEQSAFVQECMDDGFASVTLVDGDVLAQNGKKINAKVDNNGNLTISANDLEYARKVSRHERIHLWLQSKGGRRAEFVRTTLNNLIPKRMLTQLFDAYMTTYADVYSNLSGEALNDAIYEEILCDMYGGLDNYGVKAGAYLNAATKAIDKSGIRESYLSSRPADTQTTSEQVAETTENTTAQETSTRTGPPDDGIEEKVMRDLGVDDEENIDVNDMLGEEDYAGEDYTEEDLEGVEFSADFLDEEYYSVANTDEEIKEKLLTPETRQALEKNDLTIQDGVVVTNENAELMRTEGYQKPQDWTEQYSVKTEPQWEESFKEQGGDPAVAEAVRRITDWMIANEAVYDYLPHGEYAESKFGPLRANMEYVFTYDMDASCPRTFQYIYIRDQLQRIAKRPLTFNESINLLNVMKKTNQMIPCTYCYVENKRILKSNNYLNYFAARDGVMSAKDAKEAMTKMYSYDAKKGTLGKAAQAVFNQWRQDVAKGEAFHPSADECWDKVMHAQMYIDNWLDGMLQIGKIKKDTPATELMDLVSKKFGITDAAALRETQNFVDQWIYETKAEIKHDLAFPNLGAIRKIDQRYLTVHNAAMQYANSASSARSVDNYVPYTDQLKNVSEKDRDFVMGMGGIRKHSSNDFRMDYVQDYLMFFADLANGKWTGHTYTKNVDYVKIFGRTGDRINLSIAFDTKDGRVVMNDQEGANWKDAKELRSAYYDNVGTMAMVTDNLQLSYALNSDWIDMIIPFHASGLPKEVWNNMKAWTDYTSKQLERYYNKDDMVAALKARGISTSKMNASEVADLYYKEFGTKMIYDEKGKRKRPHFYPNDTYVEGPNGEMQLVPGHHNDVETYFRLCEEYGVHPRFYDLMVTNAQGEVIPVTEHPNYLKLIKETARTETEQHPIEFNLDQYDDYLGMSPMEYIMERLQQEAKSGGYNNMKVDPAGIIDLFKKDYLGQDRPIGYISEGAQFKIDAYEGTTAYKEIEANALGLSNADDLQKLHGTPEDQMGLTERASVAGETTDVSGPIQSWTDEDIAAITKGLNFKDPTGELLDRVFAGSKQYETRPYSDKTGNGKLPQAYLNKPMGIVQTGAGRAQLVGFWELGDGFLADSQWLDDHKAELGNDGTEFEAHEGDQKWVYPIKYAGRTNPVEVTSPGQRERNISGITQQGRTLLQTQERELTERASVADTEVPLTEAQEKRRQFNEKQTEVGSTLKTLNSDNTRIQRYKGIAGKQISNTVKRNGVNENHQQIYVHKDYAAKVVPNDILSKAEEVLQKKHPGFSYNTIMYDKTSGDIRFDEAPDFDTAREPIAGHTVTVMTDGGTKTGYSDAIWHHKWLWVGNDYTGFDVGKSWEWSKQWLSTIRAVDPSIHKFNSSFSQRGIANGTGHGTTNWNEQLDYFGLPHDENASEIKTGSEPAVWYSVALDDPVFDSDQRQEPATDDYGGVFYITPTDDSWSVERDSHGNLINTAYLRDQQRGLGFGIWDNPTDESYVAGRQERKWGGSTAKGQGTQIAQTKGTYEKIGKQLIAAFGEERAKQFRILDASSGLGFGTQALIDMGFENVTDLEPFPPPDGSYVPNYEHYGDLITDIQNGTEQPFDIVISNAVINVMAQDARAEIVAALGKFAAPDGHIFINTFGPSNVAGGYQTLSDDIVSTPSNKRASTELQPDTGKTGREAYIKQTKTIQKAFYPDELKGFVRDVLNQTGTENVGFSGTGGLGINSTWVDLDGRSIKQQAKETTERYSVSENENNQFPKGTLAHEMLDLIRAEGPEGLEKWVNNMLEKNAEQKEQRGTKPVIPPADKQLPVGKVERAIQRGKLDEAIEQYGRLRPGENPSKDIALPKKTGKDAYVRRFFQNAEEAKGVSQRTVEMVERGIITHEDVATYARISDTKANHAADTLLGKFGYNGLMKKWNDEITSVSNRPTKYDIAVGERLLIEADRNGDSATATKIIADLATMGTEAGQVVQAMRLLKKLGPVGQLYYMQRAIDKMNKKYQGRIAKGKMDPIQINQELAQNVLLAETQEDIDKAMKALIKDTANKLPVNLKDKWDAWRYLAMLGNPRTHIRNWLGNDFFRPVRFAKDLLAAAGESIFLKDRSERTKSAAYLLSGGRYSAKYRELNQFAASDFEVMQGDITGTGKMNLTNELLQARDVFKHLKFLNKLSEANSNLLEKEDAFYLKRAYVNAMAEYMAARGLTAQDLSENTRELNQARQYAALEAQKATYRDFSWLASALNNLKHSHSAASMLLDGVMPFTKTPMNILSRGLEYSPLGLMKGLTIDLAKVQKGDLTAAEAIDHIAGGMTGTMVAVLGAMLAHLGIARGSDDDDKKKAELERAQGHQEYSLEIGGKSFTVDWVAPISLPFFVGVEAYNQITQGGPMDFWDFCDVMTLIAEPMLSLSMLDGVNNMLTSASYADNNAIQSIMMSASTSLLSQGLPTLGAQIARTIDPYRRATYIDKNSNTPTWMQQFVQQNQGKIPGLASEKMAYTDIWGRKQSTGAWGLRALENIVFPFYMKNLRTNPVETELLRLSKATGDNSMLPSTLSKSFSIDGESVNLTAKQYEKAKSTYGKTSLKLLGDLMGTQAYAAMDDEQKAAAIKNALTVSAAVGRKAVKEDYAPAAWVQRAIDQDNFEDAVMFHTLQNMETGLTNYQIIECMYWLTPEDQGKLILSQFTPQAKMTDYTQKKYKFELDDSMKARQREIYEEQFWIAYPGLVSSQQWLAADIAGRAELVKELQTALGKQARTIYGDELRRAGVKSVYSDDPQTEAEEIAALINELGYNE